PRSGHRRDRRRTEGSHRPRVVEGPELPERPAEHGLPGADASSVGVGRAATGGAGGGGGGGGGGGQARRGGGGAGRGAGRGGGGRGAVRWTRRSVPATSGWLRCWGTRCGPAAPWSA